MGVTVYIYDSWLASFDEETLSEFLYEYFSKNFKDVGRVETEVEYAWDYVEEVEVETLEDLKEMVCNYMFVEGFRTTCL